MGLFLAFLLATQDVKLSGPQPGEKTPGFRIFDVASRQEVDVVADAKDGPFVVVFIHELTRPGGALMRALDEHGRIKQARGLRTHFVSLSEDRDGAERHLPVVVRSLGLKSLVGISVDGKEGPGAYGLNREVMLTIIVARENKVVANYAIVSPNETDAPRIKASIDDLLKAVPQTGTPEEQRLKEELAQAREEIAALKIQLEKAPKEGAPRRGEMERPKEDETLVNHCRRLIQRQATQEQLDAAVKDIDAYVGTNEELGRQYVAILNRVLDLQYGNDLGKAEMRRQLEKRKK